MGKTAFLDGLVLKDLLVLLAFKGSLVFLVLTVPMGTMAG